MIKAILFDFDGVLTVDKTGSQSILKYLSAKTGVPFDTLSALNIRPEDSVFIDNTEKNLIVPEKLGMHTILFDDANRDIEQFTEQLNAVLQSPPM